MTSNKHKNDVYDELEYEIDDEKKRTLRIDVDTHSDLSVPTLGTTSSNNNNNNNRQAPSWVTPRHDDYVSQSTDDVRRRNIVHSHQQEESSIPFWHKTTTTTKSTNGSQVGSDVYSDTSIHSRKRVTARRRPRPWDSPREDTPLLKQQSLDRHVIGPDEEDEEEEEEEDPVTPLWSGRLLTQSSKKHDLKTTQQSRLPNQNYWFIVGMTMHMVGIMIYDFLLRKNRWTLLHNWAGGPSAETLTKWGVLHPGLVLVQNQWWRFFTSITCTTSLVQYALSVYICYQTPSSLSLLTSLGSTTLAAIWTSLVLHQDTTLPLTGLMPAALSAMLVSTIPYNKQHMALYLLQIISVYLLPYNSPCTVWAGTTLGLLQALYTSPEQPMVVDDKEVLPSPHYLDTPQPSSIHDYFSPISSLVSPEEEQDLLRYDVYTHTTTTEVPSTTTVKSTKKTLAMCGICIVWIVSLWVLTLFYPQQLPTQLQIQDATYGCHTVYQMTVDSNTKVNYCHQVCLPLWFSSTEGIHGQCSDYRFTCFDHTDAFPINSKIAIQRDWYTINKNNNNNACQ